MAAASAIPGIDMATLMGDPEVQKAAPQTPLESALADVSPTEAAASTPAEAKFEFRSLLSDEQRAALKASAPVVAERMIKDYNQILNFGAPVLEKMNQASIVLLNEQKDIKIPEADQIVNNLLREMDGYNAKYRNMKMENVVAKFKKLLGGAGYTVKTMIRDAKPISDRLDEAEVKVREMEINLGSNSDRARKLHEQTLETMDDVVAVLAALEEIASYIRVKFETADAVLRKAGEDEQKIVFEGKSYSLSEFKEYHADLAQGLSEVEKSWFDFRQQFFLGFASAPTLRNLILVSASMQRRLLVFRTQGIPSARRGLAMWQQAALAKQGAEMGDSLQKGTNTMIQNSFAASADAVEYVAKASQAPVITEETVFAVIDSVKKQAQSLVDADKWGRDMRTKNLAALERGEKEIAQVDAEGRRKMVANAVAAASTDLKGAPDMPSGDILSQLGVKSK
jgi:uncharacterized protein YaaN involved in tellurite resistance